MEFRHSLKGLLRLPIFLDSQVALTVSTQEGVDKLVGGGQALDLTLAALFHSHTWLFGGQHEDPKAGAIVDDIDVAGVVDGQSLRALQVDERKLCRGVGTRGKPEHLL